MLERARDSNAAMCDPNCTCAACAACAAALLVSKGNVFQFTEGDLSQ